MIWIAFVGGGRVFVIEAPLTTLSHILAEWLDDRTSDETCCVHSEHNYHVGSQGRAK